MSQRNLNLAASGLVALILALAGAAAVHSSFVMPSGNLEVALKLIDALIKLLQVIVWPLVVICFLRLLRPYLGSLVENLESGKVGFPGGSIEFQLAKAREKLEKVEERSVVDEEDSLDANDSISYEAYYRLAEQHPSGAIVSAYIPIELALRAAWNEYKGSGQSVVATYGYPISIANVTRELERAGIVDQDLSSVLRALRKVRNEAAHSARFNVTAEEAMEFRNIAASTASQIRGLKIRSVFSSPS